MDFSHGISLGGIEWLKALHTYTVVMVIMVKYDVTCERLIALEAHTVVRRDVTKFEFEFDNI